MLSWYHSIYEFVDRNEKILSWCAFVFGFAWDNITLGRVDRVVDLLILSSFLIVATLGMLLINYADNESKKPAWVTNISAWFPLMVQFSFGGLFSGLFVFYSRSGSLSAGWPFILLIVFLLVGNEFFRRRYQGIVFQIAVYFIAVLSFCALVTPVLAKQMSESIFVLSTAIASVWMIFVLRAVRLTAPQRWRDGKHYILGVLIVQFAFFHFLYFANIIPPIPLAIKEVGIYHYVERNADGSYEVRYEKPAWWKFFQHSDSVFHLGSGPAYCYSSVFAPTDITITIFHVWESFDEVSKKWREELRVPFQINGGRGSGYRGYTIKATLTEGAWRCSVQTERGGLIGRKSFMVEKGNTDAQYITAVR